MLVKNYAGKLTLHLFDIIMCYYLFLLFIWVSDVVFVRWACCLYKCLQYVAVLVFFFIQMFWHTSIYVVWTFLLCYLYFRKCHLVCNGFLKEYSLLDKALSIVYQILRLTIIGPFHRMGAICFQNSSKKLLSIFFKD